MTDAVGCDGPFATPPPVMRMRPGRYIAPDPLRGAVPRLIQVWLATLSVFACASIGEIT
jgi:hypothetical protein